MDAMLMLEDDTFNFYFAVPDQLEMHRCKWQTPALADTQVIYSH